MTEVIFRVPERIDGDAVKAITRAIRSLDGVSQVEVDPHTGWVVITGSRIDGDRVRQAIGRAGYAVQA